MDGRSFDHLARWLGQSGTRRDLIKALVGGLTVAVAATIADGPVEAARRGFSGPRISCLPGCDGLSCGGDGCGGTCPCASGRVCLPNGTCGLPCVSSPQCQQLGCQTCWGTVQGQFCGYDDLQTPVSGSCMNSTANCPQGYVCAGGAVCAATC